MWTGGRYIFIPTQKAIRYNVNLALIQRFIYD